MAIQRDIKKIEIPISNLQLPVSPNNTLPIQFRVTTEDGVKVSAWSNIYEIPGLPIVNGNIVTMVNKIGPTKKVAVSWDDENNANLYDIFVYRFQNINISAGGIGSISLTKTATVATGTLFAGKNGVGTKMEHGLKQGMTITVANTLPQFDRVGTTVTEIVDPYTFKYSPVGNTDTTPTIQNDFTITAAATQPTGYELNDEDYIYVATTNKTSYNLSKSFNILTEVNGQQYAANATHMFAYIQVASSDKRLANPLLEVGFANLATP